MRKDERMTMRTKPIDRAKEVRAAAKRVPVNLSLPEGLVQELDLVSGARNRSSFVEEAVRRAIRRERLRVSIERTAGSLPDDRYPHWKTSEDVVAWVRQMRAEETRGPEGA